MDYYFRAFKKYADFEGRDNRPQYWYFVLLSIIVSIILQFIDSLIPGTNFLSYLYFLVVLIPSIAIAVRRLHDVGKSGWWLLIGLIPLIGWIWLLVLLAGKSRNKSNELAGV